MGKTWKDVGLTVWDKVEGEYSFKKAHAIAYAQLVVVNLNLLNDNTI
jgi:DNA polymerase III alpha subunit